MPNSSDLTAAQVMDKSASLLNDTVRSVYTYSAQLPYLQIALQELQETFELNNIPTAEQVSAVIPVLAGITQLTIGTTSTSLPSNLVEPLQVWERASGVDPFIMMTRREFLPHQLEATPTSQFIYYVWRNQSMYFIAANRNNDIKIDYVRELFQILTDENSQINLINARTFLEYRTAALCAEFIERNQGSSNSLNQYALMAADRAMGISIKGKQNIMTRRKPFRAGYKKSSWM